MLRHFCGCLEGFLSSFAHEIISTFPFFSVPIIGILERSLEDLGEFLGGGGSTSVYFIFHEFIIEFYMLDVGVQWNVSGSLGIDKT